ncbi:MAG TPA: ATP-binding protein, partial [Geminicoccaceae bacterium]|nr:ATP-binding protein [Geminicoccaceae bacterium]
MRLAPRSIAGRITLVLIGGLFLTLVASIGVASIGGPFGDDHLRYPRLVGRVATVAAIAGSAPAERRPEVLERVARPPLDAHWSPTAQPPAGGATNWLSRHLSRDLRQALGDLGPAAIVIDDSPAEEVAAWLQLSDGSWLTVTVDREALGALWPLRFGLGLSVLTGGIALLAVWAARRVTVPLGRFAQAAGRLGTDVNAPPMAEAGPSEIVQAARAFNQMQERIQRLVDDRTRMLAAIAHDLRTVLTRLRLRAELIDDAEQQEKAIADLDAMTIMLDETLAFARDDGAGEARQDVDLAVLVRSLCDDLADAGQPVQYLGPDRLRFACRPVALRRALANLIDNAVKYGREAQVGLHTERATIRLTIEDRGPGIPAAAREQVFQPFFRLEPSRSRATGGTGLGLAVAR